MTVPHRWIALIIITSVFGSLIAALIPAVGEARYAAQHSVSRGHLKQWAVAVYNYEAVYHRLPPGGWVGDDDTELHGWVTLLLPYVDANPYYSRLDLHQPWHDPANQPIGRINLSMALHPAIVETRTDEGYGLIHYAANPNVMHRNTSLTFDDLKGGLSQTFLVGEAAGEYRPWACPWNWRPIGESLNTSPAGYGSPRPKSTNFAFADGRVRTIPYDVDPVVLRQLSAAGPEVSDELTARPPIPDHYPSTLTNDVFTGGNRK